MSTSENPPQTDAEKIAELERSNAELRRQNGELEAENSRLRRLPPTVVYDHGYIPGHPCGGD